MLGFIEKLFAPAAAQTAAPACSPSHDETEAPASLTIGTSLELYSLAERIRQMSKPEASAPQAAPK